MEAETMNPAAGATANGARGALVESDRPEPTTGKPVKATLKVRLDGSPVTLEGRLAQTLELLIQTGTRGFTSGEASPLGWARRTSHYVHKLRRMGFPIVTLQERVMDARVGRYVLTAPVVVLTDGGG